MVISLFDSHARKLRAGAGHIPRKSEQLHDGILVGGHALVSESNKVSPTIRTEENIFAVQKIRMVSRCIAANPAVQYHIGVHVLDGREPEVRQLTVAGKPL